MKLVIVIYYNSWMQLFFEKPKKHIPRMITGAPLRVRIVIRIQ
jgi:hypothetical protein